MTLTDKAPKDCTEKELSVASLPDEDFKTLAEAIVTLESADANTFRNSEGK